MVGLSELIKLALFCDSLGVEVLDFAKEMPDTDLCCAMVGRKLAYSASISASGELSLSVSNADGLDEPQRILRGVAPSDWKIVGRTISALEFSGVDSVAVRPFEVVDRWGMKWVIA